MTQQIKSELSGQHCGQHEEKELGLREVKHNFSAILEFVLDVSVNALYGFHGDIKDKFYGLCFTVGF